MDMADVDSFIESLGGSCAFVDDRGVLLVVTPHFEEVFGDSKSLETSLELFEMDVDGVKNLHMEILSEMRAGLKDFADMTIRWRGQCYLLQFVASRHGGVFWGALVNVNNISDRARADERSRRELNDLTLLQKIAFGREKKMDELRQKIEDLARQLEARGVA